MNTASAPQDVTSLLSRIDSFVDTPFDSVCSDKDVFSARRAQIKGHISDLEEIQSDHIERIQRKLGLAFAEGLRPGSTQHKTDMRAVASRIRALKSLLNMLVPIHRLPTELLHLIITFHMGDFMEPFRLSLTSKTSLPTEVLERVKTTHVCRKWREVALGDPMLWSHISSPAQPEWALEMLARSRDAPLAFTADFFDLSHGGQDATRKILEQMCRIQELSLAVPEPGAMDTELVQPAPSLKSFTIRVYRELRPHELAQPLFQGIAPKLRHMSLDKCQIPWDSHLFDGLTVLRLANLNLHHDITPAQFLDIFTRIPNLHTLRIMSVEFDFRNNTPYAPPERLVLPNLNFLTLSCSASTCRFFLEHVDLSKNPSIYLAFNLRREQIVQTPASLINSFTRHLASLERPLRHLSVEGLSKSSLRFEGSLTAHHMSTTHLAAVAPRAHFTFRVSTDLHLAMYQLVAALPPAFLGCLPPAGHLRTLLLKGWGACTVCRPGVPALSAVSSIILHGRAAGEWLAHMNGAAGAGALPGLRRVAFQGAVFTQEESALFRTLMTFLRSERMGCVALEGLEFRSCVALEPAEVGQLRELVNEIILYENV